MPKPFIQGEGKLIDNCLFCGRPVHTDPHGKGLVHVEPLGSMVVTQAEAERVMANAERNKDLAPPDRIYGLAIHQPTRESI